MFGPKGTDPKGLRISATQYFARNIAFKVAQKSPHRVGIINFGTTAPKKLMIPLTKANEDSIELVMSKLKVVNLHYTSFISALKVAYQEFTAKGSFISPGRKPIVIIFTDGRPDDPRHLAPGHSVVAETSEKITLPNDICGWITGRGKLVILGLNLQISTGFVQPGTSGEQLFFLLTNLSTAFVSLTPGTKICQLVLQRVG